MTAVGLVPIMMTTAGHVSPDRLKQLAEAAANFARELSQEARTKWPSGKRGAFTQVRAAREPADIVSHDW